MGAILDKYLEIARQFQGNRWQSPGNLQGIFKYVWERILVKGWLGNIQDNFHRIASCQCSTGAILDKYLEIAR